MGRLADRQAVVTGGARGIGAAIAEAYIEEGAEVAVLDIDPAVAHQAQQLGERCQALEVDVASESSVRAAFDQLEASGFRCDLLVNNAAVQREGAILEQRLDDVRTVIDTNLIGTFLCTRAVLPTMLQARYGVIINMSSVLGLTGDGLLPIYSATKHAILGLTKSTAVAYAAQGVRCVAICPGDVDTELNVQYFDSQPDPAAFRARVEREYPARRMGRPEEIARLAVALATDDAALVNGGHVLADGGIMARLFDLY
jgi:meso-butanediol dehydrogenase/(S,S)-butanediol dehydrogenase/diacetyl reductase